MKYVPEVFKLVRARGYEYECPIKVIRTELKRATGVINNRTIGNWIQNLQEMGYIKIKNDYVVELCTDLDRPYEFISDKVGDDDGRRSISKESSKSETDNTGNA